MKPLTPFLSSSFLTGLASSTGCTLKPPYAVTDSGPVLGVEVELPYAANKVYKFLGIPYGKAGRFELPGEVDPWTEALNATEYGYSCFQHYAVNSMAPSVDLLQGLFSDNAPQSDDCLYINAFKPANAGPKTGRPVLVFVHGGGWQMGNGRLDMSGFAGYEDLVAFDFNYRTNVFGFPNSPDIPIHERNPGIYDQRLALEWVQRNAAAFGGDPKKVTIWGTSAGAQSIDLHLLYYKDKPPFRGAILSSGQMSWGMLGYASDPATTDRWSDVAEAVGCPAEDSLSCMKNVNATLILESMQDLGIAFSPVKDNVTVPSRRAEKWREGDVARVPLLTGTVAEEGRSLIARNLSLDLFIELYLPEYHVTKEQRSTILHHYRSLPHIKTDFDLAAAIQTDFWWQCPQKLHALASASIGNPTWRYLWNISITELLPQEYSWLGKFHGSDVLLFFATPTFEGRIWGYKPLAPQLYTFASYFRGAIGRFVKSPVLGPGWPAVVSESEPFDVVSLGDLGDAKAGGATPVNQTMLDERCQLWEPIYPLIEDVLG